MLTGICPGDTGHECGVANIPNAWVAMRRSACKIDVDYGVCGGD